MSPTSLTDLGSPIAVGNTAEIYAWKPGWVLKLFFERYSHAAVVFEHRLATAVAAAELSVPAVGETVTLEAENRHGILYERRDGQPMAEALFKRPWRLKPYARQFAQLHVQLHAIPISVNLPPLHQRLQRKIEQASVLPDQLRTAALNALAQIPGGNQICHGDFHPGNVLLSQPAPTLIDWVDAAIGHPAADVARTSILLLGVTELEVPRPLRWYTRRFHDLYLRHYFQLRPQHQHEYAAWLPIVAAARLEEGVSGWESWLLTQASKLQ